MQNQKAYSVYIVEDEYYSCEKIKRYVNTRNELDLKGYSDEADKAIEDLNKNRHDLLFLDITLEWESLSGLEILKRIKDPPFVIYTTGHNRSEVNITEDDYYIDYLIKPITIDKFNSAVDKFLEIKRNINK